MDKLMGARGPKPVDRDFLRGEATAWAALLYILRDGHPGSMQHVKWGKRRKIGAAKWTSVPSGSGTVMLPANTSFRESEPLGPPILIPVSKHARQLPPKMEANGWVIFRPTSPAPEVWDLLKRANSVGEIQKASRDIGKWMAREFGPEVGRWLPGDPPVEFTEVLSRNAKSVLDGKRLPSYAKTDWPSSDDKRVEFLSKVLAGARLGLAPITAAKLLSHWHWPRDSAEKALREHIERSEKQFAKASERGKTI